MHSLQTPVHPLVSQFSYGKMLPLGFQQLDHAFEQQARLNPDAIAVAHADKQLTYSQLNQRAAQLAAILQQRGVKENTCVGLFLERSLEMVIGIIAILKCGATYVPQDVKIAPLGLFRQIVVTCDIKLVLTLKHLQQRMPDNCECIALDCLPSAKTQPIIISSRYNPLRRAVVLFTSGTTGIPNAVAVSHRNISNLISLAPGHIGTAKGMRVAQIMNIAFDMAAWEIFLALCHGATLVIRGKSIAAAAMQADILIATPSILTGINPRVCRQLNTVAVAGEVCPPSLAELWAQCCNFYNCYGPTEVTIINSAKKHSVGDAISIGKPLPNTSVYILDEQHNPCPIGMIGELYVGGLGVTDGYLNNQILTQQRYLPDPFCGGDALMFRTRDRGRWTANGEIEYCGRTDEQVKIKGFRVELLAIANILEAQSLCQAAVSMHAHGDIITFVIAPRCSLKKIRQALALQLPYYAMPAAMHVLREFPLTTRGKIDKHALLALLSA